MYLAMSYGGRRGIRRLQNPVVSSGIVHRSSSPGVVELSKETSIQNSKIFVLLAIRDFRLLKY